MSNQQKIFILEGNIGAGKSTFLSLIDQLLPIQVIYEPHTQWQKVGLDGENLLDKFYKDTKRWAYTFQSYAFVTRIMEQNKYSQLDPSSLQLLERSVYSDRYCFAKNCFETGFMTSLEWSLYIQWFDWLIESYGKKPDGFIYLQTDPSICYQRLVKRGRSEELNVSLEYLNMLHNKHEKWLIEKEDISSSLQDIPVLVLNCNQEFESNSEVMKNFKEQIVNFVTPIISN